MDEYKSLLFQNSDGKVVVNKTILASDLACLACDNWLNLATIQGFVDLLNDQSTEAAVFVLNNLIGLNEKQLQALPNSRRKVNYITFIVNIGGNLKETFVAKPDKPGYHWTLLFIDTTENKWFYCDTLGWTPPSDLKPRVNFILDVFSHELPLPASPDPDDGQSNPPDNGEPLAASLDPDTSKSSLSANSDSPTTSAGPDDSERDPSENGNVPPSSPGPDDSESTPSENGYPPQPSPGPNEGESNSSENRDPPLACPSLDDGRSSPSQPEAPGNETLPNCFQCPFCDLICNVKSNLKRHIKRKHKDQQNGTGSLDDSGKCLCLECGFKFHRITDLRQHLT